LVLSRTSVLQAAAWRNAFGVDRPAVEGYLDRTIKRSMMRGVVVMFEVNR
jgi:hypothetical protein